MKRKFISLQTKILSLVFLLLLLIILVLASIFTYFESKQINKHMGQLALQVAKTVSFMNSVKEAFTLEDPSIVLQPIAEKVREEVGAAYVIIANKDEIQYSHPYTSQLGNKMNTKENYKAIVFGGYYTIQSNGMMGPALNGKAPIFSKDDNQIIGVVTVGYLLEDIHREVMSSVLRVIGFAALVMLLGIFGSILLAKNIRKDTLGLEPHEIAALYRERNAILFSIKEGIIAIDKNGNITMMNNSAKKMLHLSDEYLHSRIEAVIPVIDMMSVLKSGVPINNEEVILKGKVFIVNCTAVFDGKEIVGVVSTFRDKTDLIYMIDTISEIKQYSEGLRAQTHEYTNKLYVLSGFLQLQNYEDAVEMIQQESKINANQNKILFEQIKDTKLQAILLGKISKASEQKINFIIDYNSEVEHIPNHIGILQLITIVGNLIDNAYEAVADQTEREVTFFAMDVGLDLIIEVSDNGPGILEENLENIFKKGFSTKERDGRGYGLANVKETVEELNGTIQVENSKTGGTIFTIYIPTKEKL